MFNILALSIFIVTLIFAVIFIYKVAKNKDKAEQGGGGIVTGDEPNPNDNQTT